MPDHRSRTLVSLTLANTNKKTNFHPRKIFVHLEQGFAFASVNFLPVLCCVSVCENGSKEMLGESVHVYFPGTRLVYFIGALLAELGFYAF